LEQEDGCGVTLPGCGFYPTLFYYIYLNLQYSSSCSILFVESVATAKKTELKTKHIQWILLHFSYARFKPCFRIILNIKTRMNLRLML